MSTDSQSSSSPPIDVHGFDRSLVRYGSITLLIVGTFGNIVSSIIFSYGTLRKSSTFRYLAILSLMDLLVLYSGLLDLFLMVEYGNEYSLRTLHPVTCRLHTFITYWSQHSSSWILSFISVDRAVATNCIRFARKFCTPRSAEYIVGTILLLIALINCHELIFLTIQTSNPEGVQMHTTTSSTPGSTLSIRQSLLSNMISIDTGNANRSLRARHIQSIPSICDKTPWNVSCLRHRRDSLFPDAASTTSTHSMQAKPIRSCRALENSQYEYFWDNVWQWIDVCLYALIPFTVMCIGTFFIVYRVYYQQRRVFRSRRVNQNHALGTAPNKAKGLFYLLFTLNLLYFVLVSPVVLVTTILFRDPDKELAYPRVKAIIYLMQFCNHSLNFIFYGITSPPYRRTLCEWFQLSLAHLPRCCQQQMQNRSKLFRLPDRHLPRMMKTDHERRTRPDEMNAFNMANDNIHVQHESISLVPR